ncbi:hypothetical protein HDU98_001514 [Podochytrium sp. JEL0797]|nr:hypothetical protein HDU98_001514 [Podochytrium sp. JEL0797]
MFILAVYHFWLVSVIRKNPELTVYGLSAHSRKAWVAAVMKDHKDILAVQSLRNLIMAASILASTCVAIIFGFIAFLATVVSHPDTTQTAGNPLGNQFGFVLDELFGTKVMLLLIFFCVAFFCFAQSMRFYNHVGMVINIDLTNAELEEYLCLGPAARDDESDTCDHHDSHSETALAEHCATRVDISTSPRASSTLVRTSVQTNPNSTEPHHANAADLVHRTASPLKSIKRFSTFDNTRQVESHRHDSPSRRRERHLNVRARAVKVDFVARMLNRGSMYYTLGMRGYYIAFPAMAYLWGPWALLGTTVLLVGILRVVDFNLEDLSPAEFEPRFEEGNRYEK